MVTEVAEPAYVAYWQSTGPLVEATREHCEAPSTQSYAQARARFGETMESWQRLQPLNFGPLSWASRAWRIQFWPDKRGTARRQLRRALSKAGPALLAPGALADRSVALQSLAAYELLLFEHVETSRASYACELAHAIARYQAGLAAELMGDWRDGGFAEMLRTAEAGSGRYASTSEVAGEFYRAMVSTLDVIARNKLERPLGIDQKGRTDPRPKRLDGWRSGRALASIEANVATVTALYETVGGLGAAVAARDAAADASVRTAIAELRAALAAVQSPLSQTVLEPAGQQATVALLDKVRALRAVLAGPVGSALGLGVGFNSADGD